MPRADKEMVSNLRLPNGLAVGNELIERAKRQAKNEKAAAKQIEFVSWVLWFRWRCHDLKWMFLMIRLMLAHMIEVVILVGFSFLTLWLPIWFHYDMKSR